MERTLSIIKPDAVAKNVIGEMYSRFEQKGFKIVAAKMMRLTTEQAKGFYSEHQSKPFFLELVAFMCSGRAMVQVLECENAIVKYRDLMGHTDPKKADSGTLRADFADSISANAVHGSDSSVAAQREINFFFESAEICSTN